MPATFENQIFIHRRRAAAYPSIQPTSSVLDFVTIVITASFHPAFWNHKNDPRIAFNLITCLAISTDAGRERPA
jgi:hypothetical protein